jgi:putative glutamine amidotransferase
MALPLIGITTGRSTSAAGITQIGITENYIRAVRRAGGLPVLIPVSLTPEELEELFPILDGILLTGGADIDPKRFNGAAHPRVYEIDSERDEMEIWLVQQAAEQHKTFLGICRGIQVINVAMGGSLFTDIADQAPNPLRHDWYPDVPRDYLAHNVTLVSGSHLADILELQTTQVNSLHHQAIQKLASGLRPLAYAPDGLVEAVELPGHPFGLGVQWHPEWMPNAPEMVRLFRAFVQSAIR